MPMRGSGLAVAAARTTFSPKRTTAEPPACLASFPVSIERYFPPAISTEIFVTSGFIDHHPLYGKEGHARGRGVRVDKRMPGGGWERTLLRLSESGTGPARSRSRRYLRMPSLEITVLYRSESYFFK